MAKEYVSSCCKAQVQVEMGAEDFPGNENQNGNTLYYVCTRCGKPCDPIKKEGVARDSADLLKKEQQDRKQRQKYIKAAKKMKLDFRGVYSNRKCPECDSQILLGNDGQHIWSFCPKCKKKINIVAEPPTFPRFPDD